MPRTPWMEPSTLAPGCRLRISSAAPTMVWLMTAVGPPPCAMTKVPAILTSPGRWIRRHIRLSCEITQRESPEHDPELRFGRDRLAETVSSLAALQPRSDDDDRVLPGNPAVEVDDVLVDQAHAARRHRLADAPPFGRAMDAVAGVLAVLVDVERARAERIGRGRRAGRRAISPVPACARSSRPAASRPAIPCRTGCWRGRTNGSRRLPMPTP